MLSTSDVTSLESALLPIKLAAAIVFAYILHEFVRDKFDDDEPDGFA